LPYHLAQQTGEQLFLDEIFRSELVLLEKLRHRGDGERWKSFTGESIRDERDRTPCQDRPQVVDVGVAVDAHGQERRNERAC
jgi:hypothetical protein